MNSKKVKVKSIAMGTYEIECINSLNSVINEVLLSDYIDTSICYNNDYFLSKIISKTTPIISKIPPHMSDDYEFYMDNHLSSLDRDYIDIMLIHNSRSEKWKELLIKLNSDKRIKEVGVSNFNIDEIKEYYAIIGEYPKYLEIEINPNYYDMNLIKFCEDNNIKIISYAILGGKYNARRNLSTYGMDYLLKFAAVLSDIVIIRSDNFDRYKVMVDKLSELRNQSEVYMDILKVNVNNKSIIPDKYSYPYNYPIYLFTNEYYQGSIPTYSSSYTPNYKDSNSTYCNILNTNKIELNDFSESFSEKSKQNKKFNILRSYIDGIERRLNESYKLEFVTDYRVYYRYKIIEFLKSLYSSYKISIKTLGCNNDILDIKLIPYSSITQSPKIELLLSVSIYDVDNKALTKVNNKNSKVVVNIIPLKLS